MQSRLLSTCCFLLTLVFFQACGSSSKKEKKESLREEYENDDSDVEEGVLMMQELYPKFANLDTATIETYLEKHLGENIGEFYAVFNDRIKDLGSYHSFQVTCTTLRITGAGKDTAYIYAWVKVVYFYHECEDYFRFRKIDTDSWELVEYELENASGYDCGISAVQDIKDQFELLTHGFVTHDSADVMQLAGNDKAWYDTLMTLSKNKFADEVSIDSIVYQSGYINKQCGAKGEGIGVLVYKVYTDGDDGQYLIYKINKTAGSDNYVLYHIFYTYELAIDAPGDVDLAKRISKDVWKIILENNVEKFFSTFHSEIKASYGPKDMKELQQNLDEFIALGNFYDYYDYYTYNSGPENFTMYYVILELETDDGEFSKLEMKFKPDANGKYMLVGIQRLAN